MSPYLSTDVPPGDARLLIGSPECPECPECPEGRGSDSAAQQVANRSREKLDPDPRSWVNPTGYPDSLALCVIDSIQSIGVRYTSVGNVLDRYRLYRRESGAEPSTDGVEELLTTFTGVGGTSIWASKIGNQHKTSTRAGAPLKAEAVWAAAQALKQLGVLTAEDLRGTSGEALERTKAAWLGVPGQRSGIAWRYVLMLAGVPGVKPDRMIRRFVAAALSVPLNKVTADVAGDAVTRAANILGVDVKALDHAIWRWQSGRTPPSASGAPATG